MTFTDEMLRLALLHAEESLESLLNAMGKASASGDATVATDTKEFLSRLREYRRQRFGPTMREQQ